MRLMDKRRARLVDYFRNGAARGMVSRRVRLVALPPTEYLHWELYGLRQRDECGEAIRVLLAGEVAGLEDQGLLPDICTIGTSVAYRIVYDENGVIDHAVRFTDTALVERCRDFIAGLYERAEPIAEFFRREIAPLPPPRPARQAIPHDYLEQAGRPRPPGR
jgi:hypothetical protein